MSTETMKFINGREGAAVGRNGRMRVSGMQAMLLTHRGQVLLAPLTSRGLPGHCEIEIPLAEIPAFIEMLQLAAAAGPDADAQRYYLQTHGAQCPRCASISMEGGMLDDDGDGYARRDVECAECGAKWQDVFRLAKFIPKQEGG